MPSSFGKRFYLESQSILVAENTQLFFWILQIGSTVKRRSSGTQEVALRITCIVLFAGPIRGEKRAAHRPRDHDHEARGKWSSSVRWDRIELGEIYNIACAGESVGNDRLTLLAQFEGDDERWSVKLHGSPRLPRLGSRSRAEYV